MTGANNGRGSASQVFRPDIKAVDGLPPGVFFDGSARFYHAGDSRVAEHEILSVRTRERPQVAQRTKATEETTRLCIQPLGTL